MKEKPTGVRPCLNSGSEENWIVDIKAEGPNKGYVHPDGIAGILYEYKSKAAAEKAEELYLEKLQKRCGSCNLFNLKAQGNCDHPGYGTLATNHPCDRWKPKTSAEKELVVGAKQTNPKDIIGIKKVPPSTLSIPVMLEMSLGMFEGARKYGRHNYRAMGVSATVYYDATMRHLMDWFEGEDIDPDSGLNHVTKAMTALLVLRDSMMKGNWTDDRPLRNPFIMADFNKKAAMIIEKFPDAKAPYLETDPEDRKCGRTT